MNKKLLLLFIFFSWNYVACANPQTLIEAVGVLCNQIMNDSLSRKKDPNAKVTALVSWLTKMLIPLQSVSRSRYRKLVEFIDDYPKKIGEAQRQPKKSKSWFPRDYVDKSITKHLTVLMKHNPKSALDLIRIFEKNIAHCFYALDARTGKGKIILKQGGDTSDFKDLKIISWFQEKALRRNAARDAFSLLSPCRHHKRVILLRDFFEPISVVA